ncbi:putative short-chain dehydrogenase [Mycobacterium xenopi 4042]|uniref:Putative short-chain dehydrogenase n=1 Tax=Mycobacterium xenopi 4042 TaxID=1299334 RepID=X7ZCC8_MYCXE|nr:putative short-chain dehydrogenase [Mycobacterium xenopi 4042]
MKAGAGACDQHVQPQRRQRPHGNTGIQRRKEALRALTPRRAGMGTHRRHRQRDLPARRAKRSFRPSGNTRSWRRWPMRPTRWAASATRTKTSRRSRCFWPAKAAGT